MRYTILLDWDAEAGMYVVTVPVLQGCVTQGPTREVAAERAREAIAGRLEALVALGRPVPVEEPLLVPLVVEVEAGVPTAAGAA